jgi:hypothetical protein
MHFSEKSKLRIIRWGAIFVLLMVMLPSITYVGHWDPFGVSPTHAHSLHHDPDAQQDHAAHCHSGPSTCTGPQATVGSWWIGGDPSPVTAPEPTLAVPITDDQSETQAFTARVVPPPRAA